MLPLGMRVLVFDNMPDQKNTNPKRLQYFTAMQTENWRDSIFGVVSVLVFPLLQNEPRVPDQERIELRIKQLNSLNPNPWK